MKIIKISILTIFAALASTSFTTESQAQGRRDFVVNCGCMTVSNPFWGYQAFAQAVNLRTGRIMWSRPLANTFLGPNAQQACNNFALEQIRTNAICRN